MVSTATAQSNEAESTDTVQGKKMVSTGTAQGEKMASTGRHSNRQKTTMRHVLSCFYSPVVPAVKLLLRPLAASALGEPAAARRPA
eukprot:1159080-Pelagomonas_calceolata.AAC.14